jgi:hypothetical protein
MQIKARKSLGKHLANQDKVAYFLLGRKLSRSTLEGKMKRVIGFIILYSSFVILLCPSTNAQWEGAEVQQLLFNQSMKSRLALYVDKNDKLFLFYKQWKWDPQVQPYRDTLYLMTKEKDGEWSQPGKIGCPAFDLWSYKKYVGYDAQTGVTHIFYAASDTLYYTNSNIPNWAVSKVDSLEEYEPIEMAFDSLGNVHLVWRYDYGEWVNFMYANNSTGHWVKQQVSPPIWVGNSWTWAATLAVQKDGTAHIVHGGAPDKVLNYYLRNDSLNGTNWIVDTLPTPSVPFYMYYAYEIMADENDNIHLFTQGCEDWECRTGYFDFYYYKQSNDSTWTGPDPTYQPEPDDLAFWGAFIDPQRSLHVSLIWMGFMIPTHNYFYTNNMQGSWEEPYQILYTEPHLPTEFQFVMDSEGQGHGVFIGLEPGASWDSSGIYYLGATTGVGDEGDQNKRLSFHLFQNYPNPFNTSTVINYELKEDCHVKLNIYNLLGRKVRTLENGERSKGPHSIIWDGKDNSGKGVASGIYFYVLRAGERRKEQKMLLMK